MWTGGKRPRRGANTIYYHIRSGIDPLMNTMKFRRRWLLLGLGGLLFVVLATAVGLISTRHYWWSQQQAQQRTAALAVEALGGETQHVLSSFSPLALYFEPDDAPNVFFLSSKGITDDDLKLLESAPVTRGLFLFENRITDDGLVHFKNLVLL